MDKIKQTPEQIKFGLIAKQAVVDYLKIPESEFEIKPLITTKAYIYIATVNGKKMKVRVYPGINKNVQYHQHLEAQGFPCPKILDLQVKPNLMIKIVEWIDGKDIREIAGNLEFKYVSDEIMVEWGKYMGRLNNVKFGNHRLSIFDMFWFNFIVTPQGDVICCDMSKLYSVFCPVEDIFKWIVCNFCMPLDKKKKFIDGYFQTYKIEAERCDPALYFLERMKDASRNAN